MRTIVYIDGFNLYKGLLDQSPYKWLDLETLCRTLLPPPVDIVKIRYFTAAVKAFRDPGQPFRQQIYWRALRTSPIIEITEGFFKVKERARIRVIPPLADGTTSITTRISNEKGSDVNLATYLLRDAYNNSYDTAVIVTNDADYMLPVTIIRNELHKTIWLLKPRSWQSSDLEKVVDKQLPPITSAMLAACQFPNPLHITDGKKIYRPLEWDPDNYQTAKMPASSMGTR